uniref:Uncharacterized protein n=1 Tax=Anguilla anguilla TaxID=7936 RepID=A0A0E9SBZ4_ANGAN
MPCCFACIANLCLTNVWESMGREWSLVVILFVKLVL